MTGPPESEPRRYVVATAGHVDHGKSTLVRALTGMEPDRWAEEKRRGLTIDLGFAWTTLPSGAEVAFVDVPGHERFLGNMLAGLGPAPLVCFVVAADEGWRAQSADHRDALLALGVEHGLVVLTRSDLAPDRVEAVTTQVRRELAGTGLADAPVVSVSARTGTGLDELRAALDDVLAGTPAPDDVARVRLWVDRSFTMTGAGTVVTGTLATGRLAVGDRLELLRPDTETPATVTVRGLQRHGESVTEVGPVSRVAVNLRGVAADDVARGDALVTPGRWPRTSLVDVRRVDGAGHDGDGLDGDGLDTAPEHLTVHVGTASVPARLRPLDGDHARLTLARPEPLGRGDRVVLRDPGDRRIVGGVEVLDADPPSLVRRGDARRRAAALDTEDPSEPLRAEVRRRRAVRSDDLHRLGLTDATTSVPDGIRVHRGWWVDDAALDSWAVRLRAAVAGHHAAEPLAAGLTPRAAVDLLELPDAELLGLVVAETDVEGDGRHLWLPGHDRDVSPIEPALARLEERLRAEPFAAPEADDLAELGLGTRELAAAERAGRLLRLADGLVVLPTAPAFAMRTLAGLEQPFTTSAARQALGTTRRVVIPLLEHLDSRGWTTRIDAGHRRVNR
ncbi:selenocysteine-specific elongation factor [Knoellia remsis]|uniref:Selenocysteine-specific elongation factor n=1 Tax=Knoellia remsis TaxID=407159 RepID=A0A2T0U4Q0_9MICO|nr:selenocysteine-specific translation elongation factor [Knoellia remsis]PRY52907.1 selenocysteine-specific elongation factor [Knoellia remsis]